MHSVREIVHYGRETGKPKVITHALLSITLDIQCRKNFNTIQKKQHKVCLIRPTSLVLFLSKVNSHYQDQARQVVDLLNQRLVIVTIK